MMPIVHLQTKEGRKFATIQIPPFLELPEVLIWGARVFKSDKTFVEAENDQPIYREIFSYTVPIYGIEGGPGDWNN